MSALGLLGAFSVVGLPFALIAIVFGHMGLSRIRRAGGELGGKRAAVSGLVIGYGSAALAVVVGMSMAGLLLLGRNPDLLVAIRRRAAERRWAECGSTYQEALRLLSAGKQSEAEQLLLAANTNGRPDRRLVFAHGVCERSRWNKATAARLFESVVKLDPDSPEGRAANCALALDERRQSSDNFARLQELTAQHRWNPFYPWLFGIEARQYRRQTGRGRHSREAADAYAAALKLFDVGPVMVHHTYANVLDEELRLYTQALTHRQIAVRLEPASWNLHGLGNTLYAMERFEEAEQAYAQTSRMSPNDVSYLYDWACSLNMQQKFDECIEKCQNVVALDPKHYRAHNTWGQALRGEGQYLEALKHHRQALLITRGDTRTFKQAAETFRELGKPAESNRMLEMEASLPQPWRQAVRIISNVTGQEVPPEVR